MTDVLTSIQRILDKPDDEDCDGLLRDALRLSLLQHPDMEEDDQDTLYDCIWTLIGRYIESPEGEGEDAQILMTRLLWVVFPVLKPHAPRGSLLVSRALLVKIKRDIENQVRGLLKNLGLVIGRAKMNVFAVRAAELTDARPELAAAVEPLLKAREAVGRQIADLDRKVMRLARNVAQVRRFMTAPGVGPITALCFLATIDDPTRFRKSRSVGAYVGLTPRRYASGEIDWTGRISKCGDKLLRSYLYEAANVLLTRVAKWSALKAWGIRLAKRTGLRKAKVAVARKLAVILHRMWIEGSEFNWSSKEAANQPA
jgi:transposase